MSNTARVVREDFTWGWQGDYTNGTGARLCSSAINQYFAVDPQKSFDLCVSTVKPHNNAYKVTKNNLDSPVIFGDIKGGNDYVTLYMGADMFVARLHQRLKVKYGTPLYVWIEQ